MNYEWSKEREHSAVRWLLNVAVTFGLVPSRVGGWDGRALSGVWRARISCRRKDLPGSCTVVRVELNHTCKGQIS